MVAAIAARRRTFSTARHTEMSPEIFYNPPVFVAATKIQPGMFTSLASRQLQILRFKKYRYPALRYLNFKNGSKLYRVVFSGFVRLIHAYKYRNRQINLVQLVGFR